MRIWIRYRKGMYASGWAISNENFDELIYDTPTREDAIKAFENQFGVKVDEVIYG